MVSYATKKRLSILIPVYNEEKTLKFVIDNVLDVPLDHLNVEKEVIVVDDGSYDDTKEILSHFDSIIVISHYINQGKGSAIRTALNHATGDIILIQDADLEYDPGEYAALIQPILDNKTSVVYGSRFLKKKYPKRMNVLNFLGNKLLTWMTKILYFINITDEATCYKVFSADVIKSIKLTCQEFEFCPEVTAKLAKKKIPICEVPISYSARTLAEGKKIGLTDALQAIKTLLKFRFVN